MNNILKISLFLLTLTIGSLLFFQPVQAQSPILTSSKIDEYNSKLDTTRGFNYSANMNLEQMIAFVLKMVLSVLGTIFIVMMFIAGNDWMQAAGNEEKIKKAKQRIQSLIVGLVIILLAYALSSGFSKLLVFTTSLLK